MYGIFEIGYYSLVEIEDKKIAEDLCITMNTKIVKRRVKGETVIRYINTNKYYVKEIVKANERGIYKDTKNYC